MASLTTAHTSDLSAEQLGAARHLLDVVFEDMTDEDWEHCLGGFHALTWEAGELIGHAALVQRRMLHRGRALRSGYVEGVAVHPAHRRRGHGAELMRALERILRGAYEVGVLAASDEGIPLYRAIGWRPWTGRTSTLSPAGIVPTPEEDGYVFVLPVTAELDPAGELTCDWRDGDVW